MSLYSLRKEVIIMGCKKSGCATGTKKVNKPVKGKKKGCSK